jgi:hypothetical protein
MKWFIQIQDKEGNVLLLNQVVGDYSKYSKRIDTAGQKIAAKFPTAWRWECRPRCYTSKVMI